VTGRQLGIEARNTAESIATAKALACNRSAASRIVINDVQVRPRADAGARSDPGPPSETWFLSEASIRRALTASYGLTIGRPDLPET